MAQGVSGFGGRAVRARRGAEARPGVRPGRRGPGGYSLRAAPAGTAMTPAAWIAIGLGLTAVVEDLARRRVPNWLTAGAVAAGLACAAWGGWHGLGMAAAGAPGGVLILLPFPLCGAMGGGDEIGRAAC